MSSDADLFGVVDVSGWRIAHVETLGTKPKRWLEDPASNEYWLMKDVTFNYRSDGSAYPKGDDWAERVACGVAGALGVPAAVVELATGGPGELTSDGVISRTVLGEGESLVHGNELLEEIGVVGSTSHDRSGYTVGAVRQALDGVAAPVGNHLDTWDCFVGYLVLDALIGNTDRHQENWAVIAHMGERRLAPTFDHASSLGFQLDDQQRQERLTTGDGNRTPEAYASRARARFEGRVSPLAVACEGLALLNRRQRARWLDRCSDVDELVAPIRRVPSERLSEPARAFAQRVLRWNQKQLVSHLRTTV